MDKPTSNTSTQPVECPTNTVDTDLTDLSWLPTALYPENELSSELCTPVLNSTPIQEQWNIVDQIGVTEEISFDLQAC